MHEDSLRGTNTLTLIDKSKTSFKQDRLSTIEIGQWERSDAKKSLTCCRSQPIPTFSINFPHLFAQGLRYLLLNWSSAGSLGPGSPRPCWLQRMAARRHAERLVMYIVPIGSMYGIYANIWDILMVNVTIYSIHGSYGVYYCTHPQLKIMRNHEKETLKGTPWKTKKHFTENVNSPDVVVDSDIFRLRRSPTLGPCIPWSPQRLAALARLHYRLRIDTN